MARTAELRAQHDAAEVMVDKIFDGIASCRDERDAYPLSLNFAHPFRDGEPDSYPQMIESDHRTAAIMARVFRQWPFWRAVRPVWAGSDAIAAALRQV